MIMMMFLLLCPAQTWPPMQGVMQPGVGDDADSDVTVTPHHDTVSLLPQVLTPMLPSADPARTLVKCRSLMTGPVSFSIAHLQCCRSH